MAYADDCEAVLRVLLDEGPLSMDDLRTKCAQPMGALNKILCDLHLHGQVVPLTARVKGRKVTQYGIKELR